MHLAKDMIERQKTQGPINIRGAFIETTFWMDTLMFSWLSMTPFGVPVVPPV